MNHAPAISDMNDIIDLYQTNIAGTLLYTKQNAAAAFIVYKWNIMEHT